MDFVRGPVSRTDGFMFVNPCSLDLHIKIPFCHDAHRCVRHICRYIWTKLKHRASIIPVDWYGLYTNIQKCYTHIFRQSFTKYASVFVLQTNAIQSIGWSRNTPFFSFVYWLYIFDRIIITEHKNNLCNSVYWCLYINIMLVIFTAKINRGPS